MAAVNFPSSPSNGDTLTSGNSVYTYNSTKTRWDAVTTVNGIQLSSLSVGAEGTASGDGALGYNNTSGEFSYTPPDLSTYLTSETDSQTLSLSGNTLSISGGNSADLSSLTADSLPSQTGNSGEYLTTNGTTASWASVSGGGDSQKDFTSSGTVAAATAVILNGSGTVSEVSVSAAAFSSSSDSIDVITSSTYEGNSLATFDYIWDSYNDQYIALNIGIPSTKILYGQVVTVNKASNTMTAGSQQTIHSGIYGTDVIGVDLGGGKILICYRPVSGYVSAAVITNTGGTLSLGSVVSLQTMQTGATLQRVMDLCTDPDTGTSYLLMGFDSVNANPRILSITVSGTTPALASSADMQADQVSINSYGRTYDSWGSQDCRIFWNSTHSKILVVDLHLRKSTVCTVSGTTVTVPNSIALASGTNTTYKGRAIEYHPYLGVYMVVIQDGSSNAPVHMMHATFDGTTFSYPTSSSQAFTISGTGNSQRIDNQIITSSVNAGIAVISCRGEYEYKANMGTYAIGSSSYTSISANQIPTPMIYNKTWMTRGAQDISGNISFAGFYGGTDAQSRLKIAVGRLAASSTKSSYIGIAQAAVADATAVTVMLPGGISTGHTGLTAKSTYYLADDGALTATVTTVKAGVAIDATTLQVADTLGGLAVNLLSYATKANPALTGIPTAPTADAAINTTQLATTAYVTTAVGAASPSSTATSFAANGAISAHDPVVINTDGTIESAGISVSGVTQTAANQGFQDHIPAGVGQTMSYDTLNSQWLGFGAYDGVGYFGRFNASNEFNWDQGPFDIGGGSRGDNEFRQAYDSTIGRHLCIIHDLDDNRYELLQCTITTTAITAHGTGWTAGMGAMDAAEITANRVRGFYLTGTTSKVGYGGFATTGYPTVQGAIGLANGSFTVDTPLTLASYDNSGDSDTVSRFDTAYHANSGKAIAVYSTDATTIKSSTIDFSGSTPVKSDEQTMGTNRSGVNPDGPQVQISITGNTALCTVMQTVTDGTDNMNVNAYGGVINSSTGEVTWASANEVLASFTLADDPTYFMEATMQDCYSAVFYGNAVKTYRLVSFKVNDATGVVSTLEDKTITETSTRPGLTDNGMGSMTYDAGQKKTMLHLPSTSTTGGLSGWNIRTYTDSPVITGSSQANRARYIGIAKAAIADTETGAIDVSGVHDGFSGLTTATEYYIQDDGTISATVSTTPIGIAVSATKLLLNEQIDWTTDQGSTNIHAGNYTDTNTTYSIGDGGLTTNDFTDADHTKLNAIEAAADVTDTANVVAALTAGTNVTIAADGTIASTGGGGGVDWTADQGSTNIHLGNIPITGSGTIGYDSSTGVISSVVPEFTDTSWDATATSYTLEDSAYAVTLAWSGTNLVLGSGSWASTDVGKTIHVNSGKIILTATSGSYEVVTAVSSTTTAASGAWSMYAVVYDATADKLTTSGVSLNGKLANWTDNNIQYGNSGNSNWWGDAAAMAALSNPPNVNGHRQHLWKPDGTKVWANDPGGHGGVYQWDVSTAWDISTLSLNTNYIWDRNVASIGSGAMYGFCLSTDGTKGYSCWGSGTGSCIIEYAFSTAWDITTSSFVRSYTYASVNTLSNFPTSVSFKPDGTEMYVTAYNGATHSPNGTRIYQFSLSTAWNISTAAYNSNDYFRSGSTMGNMGFVFTSDGTKIIQWQDGGSFVTQYDLTTAYEISTATNAVSSSSGSMTGYESLSLKSDDSKIYLGDNKFLTQISLEGGVFATGTHPSIATSINTSTWTDINDMTTTDAIGNGTVHYAVSADAKTTWNIFDNNAGIRPIVKIESGTWKYNTNATHGSETWTNATVNTQIQALRDSMGTAVNQMTKAEFNAINDATHITLGTALDLAVILTYASGEVLPTFTSTSIAYETDTQYIEAVTAGTGLTGGGTSGSITLALSADTDDISEGSTNEYHTTARARAAISGTGSIGYNSSTGVISLASADPLTDTSWDATATSYTLEDSAYAVTLAWSGTNLVLGSGSWASTDVGKTIHVNGGKIILTATSGSYSVVSAVSSTTTAASGAWSMYGVVYDATADVLTPSNVSIGFDISSSASTNTLSGITDNARMVAWNLDGTKLITSSVLGNLKQFNLSTAYDISTATFSNNGASTTAGGPVPSLDLAGTKLLGYNSTSASSTTLAYRTLSTAFDISTISSGFTTAATSLTAFSSASMSPDGNYILFLVDNTATTVWTYPLSTTGDVTTINTSGKVQSAALSSLGNQGGTIANVRFSADGTKVFVLGGAGWQTSYGYLEEYPLSTPWDVSSMGTRTQNRPMAGVSNTGRGLTFTPDGTSILIGTFSNSGAGLDNIYQYSSSSSTAATGYQVSTSNVDTTHWDNINTLTATDSETVYYAISADAKTTWNILDNSLGVRPIAKLDSGTWKYNSNTAHASETWTNATVNSQNQAIKDSMGVTVNQMTKAEMNAITDANHITLGTSLDLAVITHYTSGTLPTYSGTSTNYDPDNNDITGVNAGTGLTGGGTSGNITLALDTSLALTGVPTAPTAATTVNDTQLATTAYVTTAVDTASVSFLEATSSTTVASGSTYILNTASAITLTLPASATLGDKVGIIDGTGAASTNNITIARNGHNIQGLAQDMTIATNRSALELVYYNTANGWLLTNV